MNTVSVTCATARCGYSPFPMEEGFNKRARQTHEDFYCPAGHSNYFPGKTRAEWLEDEVGRLERRIRNLTENFNRMHDESRMCPWPTCRERVYSSRHSLYDHMRRIHGMPLLAEVREAS